MFCETLETRKSLQVIYKTAPYRFDNNYVILQVESDFARAQVQSNRDEFLEFIRMQTQNPTILLNIVVVERKVDEAEKLKYMKEDEKKQYLEEKNPVFKIFQQRFKTAIRYD